MNEKQKIQIDFYRTRDKWDEKVNSMTTLELLDFVLPSSWPDTPLGVVKAIIRERIRRAELRPTSRYATALDVWEEYLNPASLDDAIETRVNFGAWVAKRLNKEIKCQIALMQ